MRKISVLILVYLVITNSLAQAVPKLIDSGNTVFTKMTKEIWPEGFIWYLCDSLHHDELFNNYIALTGLTGDDQVFLAETWEDSITNLIHYKYKQYYKGYRVESVNFIEHCKGNNVVFTNGYLAENINQNIEGLISEGTALDSALHYFGNNNKYFWRDDSLIKYYNEDTLNDSTIFYPHGDLLWHTPTDTVLNFHYWSVLSSSYILCWRFEISWTDTDSIVHSYTIYINAKTGTVTSVINADPHGTFTHSLSHYGVQGIDTKWYGGFYWKYFLETDDLDASGNKQRNIKTKDSEFEKHWNTVKLPSSSSDAWGSSHQKATSCHWATTMVWDYWANKHKYHGVDNKNVPLHIWANYNELNNNALFTRKSITKDGEVIIKIGDWNNGVGDIEIMGHEFTHGILWNNGQIEDGGIVGQIAESYCDIFGWLAERNYYGVNNWKYGELSDNNTYRDLEDPSTAPTGFWPYTEISRAGLPITCSYDRCYPHYFYYNNSTFQRECWCMSLCDNGCVHINGSIQNLAFYFLSVGGTNELKLPNNTPVYRTVGGIGIDKAEKIASFLLLNKMIDFSVNYWTNRAAWKAAARILYGHCSPEELEVCKAWWAVNVGDLCNCEPWEFRNCGLGDFYRPQPAERPVSNLRENNINYRIPVYPNPAEETININLSELPYNTLRTLNIIEIIDLNGKIIQTESINNIKGDRKIKLNIRPELKGIYFINLIFNNQTFNTKFYAD